MKTMKKHIAIIGILLLLTVVVLAGCNETITTTDADRLVGTWKGIDYFNTTAIMSTYTFLSDNTYNITTRYAGQVNTLEGTWELAENMLTVTSGNQTTSMDYLFSGDGKGLTIIDSGIVINLIKQ
jgi:ABC-type oligopeptide transport system substrate-binding subunit